MGFRTVFVAIFIGTALVISAMVLHARRPAVELAQPAANFVKATGKCAECHSRETSAIVHEFEMSAHSRAGVTCLDCHQALQGQEKLEHRGFVISKTLTAANCSQCHASEYQQYLKSRHATPAWAAIRGAEDFTMAQLEYGEKYHKGAVDRPANGLAKLEGSEAIASGCATCHSIGKPNADGSIGNCTACHSRHSASVALARTPRTCGQCHMGPDHSQIEIYEESKHGVLFAAQHQFMNLEADPKKLTTADMPVPTCATCHMSGLEGMNVTHDVGERLSWELFAAVSKKRDNYLRGQTNMQSLCTKCHTPQTVKKYYDQAEDIVAVVNTKVKKALDIVKKLREDKLLTPKAFDEPIEFIAFDLWHYYGRTAKHGAFMGGADFVQWHGNYEILAKTVELQKMAKEIRENAAKQGKTQAENKVKSHEQAM